MAGHPLPRGEGDASGPGGAGAVAVSPAYLQSVHGVPLPANR